MTKSRYARLAELRKTERRLFKLYVVSPFVSLYELAQASGVAPSVVHKWADRGHWHTHRSLFWCDNKLAYLQTLVQLEAQGIVMQAKSWLLMMQGYAKALEQPCNANDLASLHQGMDRAVHSYRKACRILSNAQAMQHVSEDDEAGSATVHCIPVSRETASLLASALHEMDIHNSDDAAVWQDASAFLGALHKVPNTKQARKYYKPGRSRSK